MKSTLSFEIYDFPYSGVESDLTSALADRASNWPTVYLLNSPSSIYVGETLNSSARLAAHKANPDKNLFDFETTCVILDDRFNKSATLDLESYLIRYLSGDAKFEVVNRNAGVQNKNYYERRFYLDLFDQIFEELRDRDYFDKSRREIENSDLFKYSPFKALTEDQREVVFQVLSSIRQGLTTNSGDDDWSNITHIISGQPGTGKTIVAVYLIKLLNDIKDRRFSDFDDDENPLSTFFTDEFADQLKDFKVGLVVPQQSLRETLKRVFRSTPGLHPDSVVGVWNVMNSGYKFDLLIVDEAHRLTVLSSQPSPALTKRFKEINHDLYGDEMAAKSQLDWLRDSFPQLVLFLDADQAVRPNDLSKEVIEDIIVDAKNNERFFQLQTQLRVKAGSDYIGFIEDLLNGNFYVAPNFGEYDLRFFENFDDMYKEILARESELGLARLVAGYAWKWKSKNDAQEPDIELGSHKLFWNRSDVDWVAKSDPLSEVGSIHTIQGYDLNYAAVIIGADLKFDETTERVVFSREDYFDTRGKQNNRMIGRIFSDLDIEVYIKNIYRVLLTRGIRGTYIYVVDPALRAKVSEVLNGQSPPKYDHDSGSKQQS